MLSETQEQVVKDIDDELENNQLGCDAIPQQPVAKLVFDHIDEFLSSEERRLRVLKHSQYKLQSQDLGLDRESVKLPVVGSVARR